MPVAISACFCQLARLLDVSQIGLRPLHVGKKHEQIFFSFICTIRKYITQIIIIFFIPELLTLKSRCLNNTLQLLEYILAVGLVFSFERKERSRVLHWQSNVQYSFITLASLLNECSYPLQCHTVLLPYCLLHSRGL